MICLRNILIVSIFGLPFSCIGQKHLNYSDIDSIAYEIRNSKIFNSRIEIDTINSKHVNGKVRRSFIIDSSKNELKGVVITYFLDQKYNTSTTAYFFHNSRLVKVELFDMTADYKKYNLIYLYYIDDEKEAVDEDIFNTKDLLKLKYFHQAQQILKNFNIK